MRARPQSASPLASSNHVQRKLLAASRAAAGTPEEVAAPAMTVRPHSAAPAAPGGSNITVPSVGVSFHGPPAAPDPDSIQVSLADAIERTDAIVLELRARGDLQGAARISMSALSLRRRCFARNSFESAAACYRLAALLFNGSKSALDEQGDLQVAGALLQAIEPVLIEAASVTRDWLRSRRSGEEEPGQEGHSVVHHHPNGQPSAATTSSPACRPQTASPSSHAQVPPAGRTCTQQWFALDMKVQLLSLDRLATLALVRHREGNHRRALMFSRAVVDALTVMPHDAAAAAAVMPRRRLTVDARRKEQVNDVDVDVDGMHRTPSEPSSSLHSGAPPSGERQMSQPSRRLPAPFSLYHALWERPAAWLNHAAILSALGSPDDALAASFMAYKACNTLVDAAASTSEDRRDTGMAASPATAHLLTEVGGGTECPNSHNSGGVPAISKGAKDYVSAAMALGHALWACRQAGDAPSPSTATGRGDASKEIDFQPRTAAAASSVCEAGTVQDRDGALVALYATCQQQHQCWWLRDVDPTTAAAIGQQGGLSPLSSLLPPDVRAALVTKWRGLLALSLRSVATCQRSLGQTHAATLTYRVAFNAATDALGPTHHVTEACRTALEATQAEENRQQGPPTRRGHFTREVPASQMGRHRQGVAGGPRPARIASPFSVPHLRQRDIGRTSPASSMLSAKTEADPSRATTTLPTTTFAVEAAQRRRLRGRPPWDQCFTNRLPTPLSAMALRRDDDDDAADDAEPLRSSGGAPKGGRAGSSQRDRATLPLPVASSPSSSSVSRRPSRHDDGGSDTDGRSHKHNDRARMRQGNSHRDDASRIHHAVVGHDDASSRRMRRRLEAGGDRSYGPPPQPAPVEVNAPITLHDLAYLRTVHKVRHDRRMIMSVSGETDIRRLYGLTS